MIVIGDCGLVILWMAFETKFRSSSSAYNNVMRTAAIHYIRAQARGAMQIVHIEKRSIIGYHFWPFLSSLCPVNLLTKVSIWRRRVSRSWTDAIVGGTQIWMAFLFLFHRPRDKIIFSFRLTIVCLSFDFIWNFSYYSVWKNIIVDT